MAGYCVVLSQTRHRQKKKPDKELETTLFYSMGFRKTVMSEQQHTHSGGLARVSNAPSPELCRDALLGYD